MWISEPTPVMISTISIDSWSSFLPLWAGFASHEQAERMRERDVNVRAFQGLNGVGDALRIGSGPWPLLEAALAALRESLR